MSRPVRVGEYVIERHHFRWVDEELRRQPYRLARIKSLEERFGGESELDIILGTSPREPGQRAMWTRAG